VGTGNSARTVDWEIKDVLGLNFRTQEATNFLTSIDQITLSQFYNQALGFQRILRGFIYNTNAGSSPYESL
jgi:hypothetical protein